jgi:hypothetical protein
MERLADARGLEPPAAGLKGLCPADPGWLCFASARRRSAAASRADLRDVIMFLLLNVGAPVWNRTSIDRLSSDCSATELQVRRWCGREDSNLQHRRFWAGYVCCFVPRECGARGGIRTRHCTGSKPVASYRWATRAWDLSATRPRRHYPILEHSQCQRAGSCEPKPGTSQGTAMKRSPPRSFWAEPCKQSRIAAG